MSAVMLLLFQIFVTSGIIYLLIKGIKGTLRSGGKISNDGSMICPNCGTRGDPKNITKGSIGIEIILWICFLVPGLIYSIWRMSSRQLGCPSCGQPMIGANTPNGRKLIEEQRA